MQKHGIVRSAMRIAATGTLAAVGMLAVSAPAFAQHTGQYLGNPENVPTTTGLGTAPGAPEIDPTLAAGALTLLAGGVLLLTSRRFRKAGA